MAGVEATQLVITNVEVFTDNGKINRGYIWIKDSTINEIGIGEFQKQEKVDTINGEGLKAIPGFIDGHIHGAAGADVMDATPEALDIMASVLPKEGTTSFLATTITQSTSNIEKALENVRDYRMKRGNAEILGVHLEGPFIAKSKAGAQPEKYIVPPSKQQFDNWQQLSGNNIKTVTMAPEMDKSETVIPYLLEKGINVSAGHTEVGFSGMKKAVANGVRQLTHLCNAMSGIHHRDVGAVGAAFSLKELRSELIADGIHVSPEMIEIIFKNVGRERLILITDALRAKCLQPGTYDLGGQAVTVDETQALLPGGTLAGSILKMIDGAKNMIEYTDAKLEDVIHMASVNPAKQLNMYDRKGSISVGKDADILLVDDQLSIAYTICKGHIAFKGE